MADVPEHVNHPALGELPWDPQFSRWLGDVSGRHGLVELMVDPDGSDPIEFLDVPAKLFSQFLGSEQRLLQRAVDTHVHELYGIWRSENEPNLDPMEFARALELCLIAIDTKFPLTASYVLAETVGDVFGGHSIDVEFDSELGLKRVNLVG